MKNGITDILSSLFSAPSDKTGLSQGKGSVSAKGSQPGGSTFEDVLAQLASEDAGSPAPAPTPEPANQPALSVEVLPPTSDTGVSAGSGKFFESITSVSEVDITLSERLHIDNAGQLAQAEQTLVSLAAGLSKLLGFLSNAQSVDPSQAQSALVSLSGGTLTPADAKSLLDSIQTALSKVPDSNNPLLLSSDQQSAFLNQMLQQMIQGQQVLFGSLSNPSNGGGDGTVSGAGALSSSDVFLQMSFSETQIAQFQKSNTQSSSIFIDLKTFQMSATFIQAGAVQGTQPVLPVLQPVPSSDSLLNALGQMFSDKLSLGSLPSNPAGPAVQSVQPAISAQDDLNKNFKNLVQMLVQAGASQAVLTTFLNQQKDMSNADLKQSLAQTASLDQLMNSIASNLEIPPAPPVDSTSRGNAQTVLSQSSFTSQLLVEQMFAQVSLTETVPNVSPASNGNALISTPSNSSTVHNDPTLTPSPLLDEASTQNLALPAVDSTTINALNDMVARLNVLSNQLLGFESQTKANDSTAKPSLSLEQLLGALNLSAAPTPTVGGSVSSSALSASSVPPVSGLSQSDVNQPAANAGTVDALLNGISDKPLQHETATLLGSSISAQAVTPPSDGGESSNVFSGNNLVNDAAIINETIAVAQGFQSLSILSGSVSAPQGPENFTLISQTQILQAAAASLTVQQGTALNEANLSSPVTLAPVLDSTAAAVSNNPVLPNISNVLSAGGVQGQAGLGSVLKTPSVSQDPVLVQPQPLSPVSNSVQEVVAPQPVDVQVDIKNISNNPSVADVQTPAATTAGTTVPASTAPNVSASIVTGEVVKLTVQTPAAPQSQNTNNPVVADNLSAILAVQPLGPQAVTPVATGANITSDVKVAFDQSKNTNNNSQDLLINSNLLPAVVAAQTDKASAVSNNASADNNQVFKVDSALILDQVTSQITIHASEAKAVSRMSFQLIPESLGRVTVQIALVDQAVSAKIIVSHPDVKEVLQHHMVELKTALNQAGLQIDQLQVQIQGGSSNLLAQYYQYQQEGFSYRVPVPASQAVDEAKSIENTGVLGELSVRMSLLDILA